MNLKEIFYCCFKNDESAIVEYLAILDKSSYAITEDNES